MNKELLIELLEKRAKILLKLHCQTSNEQNGRIFTERLLQIGTQIKALKEQ